MIRRGLSLQLQKANPREGRASARGPQTPPSARSISARPGAEWLAAGTCATAGGEHLRRRPGPAERGAGLRTAGLALPAQLPQRGDHRRQLQAVLAHAEGARLPAAPPRPAPAFPQPASGGQGGARRSLEGPKTPLGRCCPSGSAGPTAFRRRTRGRPGGRTGAGRAAACALLKFPGLGSGFLPSAGGARLDESWVWAAPLCYSPAGRLLGRSAKAYPPDLGRKSVACSSSDSLASQM